MKKTRRILAWLLTLVLVITGVNQFGATKAAAEESTAEAVPITSIKYDVTVSGCDKDSFVWESCDSNWSNSTVTVPVTGDGDYVITAEYSSVAGIVNMGFIQTIKDSGMTVTINKMTVNETYEIDFSDGIVLKAGSKSENGIANIWSGHVDGETVYSNADGSAYFEHSGAAYDGTIIFYAVSDSSDDSKEDVDTSTDDSEEDADTSTDDSKVEAKAEQIDIESIKYDVTVSGITNEEYFEWTSQDSGCQAGNATVALTADGDYSFEVTYNSATGLKNMGYLESIDGSVMKVTFNKMTVNGEYEITFTEPKELMVNPAEGETNALAHIWGGFEDGDVIYSNEDGTVYFAKKGASGDGDIRFYVTTTGPASESTRDPQIARDYVAAMGHGWNLGNSFDGLNTDTSEADLGETAWGNPVVTEELIKAIKDKGYDSIRIPMTLERRYTVNENAGEGEYKYVINKEWLARYKEVVDWAVADGLYVMINIHHDSWIWLSGWDGDTSSEEYRMYTDFWAQLADYFSDEPAQVCFETINEPSFSDTGSITAQTKLDTINKAAYDIIRKTPGNEERMIVMPTMSTNHEESNSKPLAKLIKELDDSYVIATVHYYSEWVYSANLGKTSFDEVLWGDNYSARAAADSLMSTLKEQFFDNGISVIIGEYGLLGYDSSESCLQTGEELKYYEYMNYLADENNVCLMFWDNGSGIDRNSSDYSWKNERVGNMLEASMTGRSSYATGLDTVYYNSEATEDTEIALTLNGNTFTGIVGLTEGTDYTYDAETATVTLKKEFVNEKYNSLNKARSESYGTFADLEFTFSSGANWHQYLVKYGESVQGESEGSKAEGISIPIEFNGRRVKRVTAYQASGKVGPNSSWWDYLQYDSSFSVDYENGTLNFLPAFFADSTVNDGLIMAKVEYYDGGIDKAWMTVDGDIVTSSEDMAVDVDDVDWVAVDTICLYAGETEIPSQYVNAPDGYTIRVVSGFSDSDMVTLVGDWPQYMEFDSESHENLEEAMLRLSYMDMSKDLVVEVGIKAAPVVSDASLKTGDTSKLTVANLAEDAVLTYSVVDPSIATVAADGTVTGVKAGTTKVIVTVSQYGRVDDFESEIVVTETQAAVTQPADDNTSNDTNNADNTTTQPGDDTNVADTELPSTTVTPSTQTPTTQEPSTEAPAATTTSPKTGDSSPVAVVVTLMMMSGMALVLLRKKREMDI